MLLKQSTLHSWSRHSTVPCLIFRWLFRNVARGATKALRHNGHDLRAYCSPRRPILLVGSLTLRFVSPLLSHRIRCWIRMDEGTISYTRLGKIDSNGLYRNDSEMESIDIKYEFEGNNVSVMETFYVLDANDWNKK